MGADTYDLLVSTRLETARLVIRTFQARDAGPWFAMVGDPEVRRFLPAGPVPTLELARRIIGERQGMERELGHAMWAVEARRRARSSGNAGCGRSMREQGRKSTSLTTTPGPAGTSSCTSEYRNRPVSRARSSRAFLSASSAVVTSCPFLPGLPSQARRE